MNNLPQWAQEIKERAEMATPGPYCRDGFNMASILKCVAERGSPDAKHTCGDYIQIAECRTENWKHDAIFFEHSRTDVPTLLNALEHYRGAIENASHGWYCAVMYTKDKNACNCWKAEALNWKPDEIEEELE